ncbi:MAG: tRNA (uridine(34)/cytosine(34)/5-carboxymethylaminomethyluridine(34)-2'-O)-methyltransferase TrmL [Vallitaleaceae bacterium]|nr:tRNA (uridine(34)/cytosine(34)/5-carboxymethylaminomethyluridine(34)-2'-O)-methyltransferase TrmL [Vallitaleaceae bacterium]
MMNILLHEPEIPQNTGNIARTCVATGTPLHLIKPLGFSIDEKSVKRAGLDYWDQLDLHVYEDFEDFCIKNPTATIYMATTKARKTYAQMSYEDGGFLMFGKETAGIPESILMAYQETSIRIPMLDSIRSLNLSNSVAIILYEALRQKDFSDLLLEGQLRDNKW